MNVIAYQLRVRVLARCVGRTYVCMYYGLFLSLPTLVGMDTSVGWIA